MHHVVRCDEVTTRQATYSTRNQTSIGETGRHGRKRRACGSLLIVRDRLDLVERKHGTIALAEREICLRKRAREHLLADFFVEVGNASGRK